MKNPIFIFPMKRSSETGGNGWRWVSVGIPVGISPFFGCFTLWPFFIGGIIGSEMISQVRHINGHQKSPIRFSFCTHKCIEKDPEMVDFHGFSAWQVQRNSQSSEFCTSQSSSRQALLVGTQRYAAANALTRLPSVPEYLDDRCGRFPINLSPHGGKDRNNELFWAKCCQMMKLSFFLYSKAPDMCWSCLHLAWCDSGMWPYHTHTHKHTHTHWDQFGTYGNRIVFCDPYHEVITPLCPLLSRGICRHGRVLTGLPAIWGSTTIHSFLGGN